jgi:hypothetical protein
LELIGITNGPVALIRSGTMMQPVGVFGVEEDHRMGHQPTIQHSLLLNQVLLSLTLFAVLPEINKMDEPVFQLLEFHKGIIH